MQYKLTIFFTALIGTGAFASQVVDEVVRMSKSGSDNAALIAYVNTAGSFNLTSDEIIQLDNAGIPTSVIVVMLDKSGDATTVAAVEPARAESQTEVIANFNETLAPYGQWSDDPQYGRVFTPTVAVESTDWQPYVDNGSWVYTDQGWLWNSGYDWGWATFHYGRWAHRDRWVWIPDNVWGPAWVSWRYSDNYYGWAPLTPQARFTAGIGFQFGNGNVDVALGLGARDYYFVGAHDFMGRNLRESGVRREERNQIYNQTTITNNYTVNNNRVVNAGIPVKTVATATRQEIKPVTLEDRAIKPGEKVSPSHVSGDKLQVVRPNIGRNSIPAADQRTVNPVTQRETPRNTSATADPRRAEMVQRIRDRAAHEAKQPNVNQRTADRTKEGNTQPNAQQPSRTELNTERNTTQPTTRETETDRARIEREKTQRIERETHRIEPDTRPQTHQPRTEPKTERQPEPRQPEPRNEVRPEPRPEPHAEPRPQPRTEGPGREERR